VSLNPLRNALTRTGLPAFQLSTPFRRTADAALADFQAVRSDLERQVKSGELTLKVARQRALASARSMREGLAKAAHDFSATPRVFLDRLNEVADARKRARSKASLESLQRDVIVLLRKSLIEQQIVNRASEFEARAFHRPINGGTPAPTLDGLIAFHESASRADDPAASEWARRQLEAFRARVASADELRRIDLATEQPDELNPRIVTRYVEGLRGESCETMETFIREALEGRDANACAAAFLLARESADPAGIRWVRTVLERLDEFPDATLAALRAWETDARTADSEAARTAAEFTATIAEAEARFPSLEPPTPDELRRREELRSRPIARVDEPIGLAMTRRGSLPDELDSAGSEGVSGGKSGGGSETAA
jgi:hypothetical protein